MIELNPMLAERCHSYADRIVLPENDAVVLPLPAEPGALHGNDPALLVVDELHVVTRDVWEAVTTVAGKRPESLTWRSPRPRRAPIASCLILWSMAAPATIQPSI